MRTTATIIHPDQYLRLAGVAGVPVEAVIRLTMAARLIRDGIADEAARQFVETGHRLTGAALREQVGGEGR